MNSILQEAYFRQRALSYANHHGKSEAARKYHVSRMSIHRWSKRYDGTVESLLERSSRPHSHPRQHTVQEDELVLRVWRSNKKLELDLLWRHLWDHHGYRRDRTTLYRVLRRLNVYKGPKKKVKPRLAKPYQRMSCPGERVQVDVKFVPSKCITGALGGTKLYQYSAIDEYSRMEFKMIFEEHSTHSSILFLKEMLRFYPFPIQCIQTDNGLEFTNRFVSDKLGAFEIALEGCGIRHKLIRPFTPRHNGKVERSHRTDQRMFYDDHRFFSLKDANVQLRVHLLWCNTRPRKCHGWKSARSVLIAFLAVAA